MFPLLGGCFGGSLATSTGPRASGDWSVAKRQAAHVGETVRFSYVLTRPFKKHPINPAGIADYCIVTLGDRAAEADLDHMGKFTLEYPMPEAWSDQEIRVCATAYRTYGLRDRTAVAGELLRVGSGSDAHDTAIARDAITMLIYQSTVELVLTPGADDFDFDTGRLVLRRADGTTTSVARARPPVGGFTVEGPDENNAFVVRYQPTWDQVNLTGATEATFVVWDRAGLRHRSETGFPTP